MPHIGRWITQCEREEMRRATAFDVSRKAALVPQVPSERPEQTGGLLSLPVPGAHDSSDGHAPTAADRLPRGRDRPQGHLRRHQSSLVVSPFVVSESHGSHPILWDTAQGQLNGTRGEERHGASQDEAQGITSPREVAADRLLEVVLREAGETETARYFLL
jgi:hypothetical protein